MSLHIAISSILPSDQDIVGNIAPPWGKTEIRTTSAHHPTAFAASADVSYGRFQVMTWLREKALSFLSAPRPLEVARFIITGDLKFRRRNWDRALRGNRAERRRRVESG